MILIVTKQGSSIAYKLFKEGQEVKLFIKHVPSRRKLKGVINKTNSFNEDADLYLFTDPGLGALADKMKSKGKNIWGASLLCDKLALDEQFAIKKLSECGLKVGGEGAKITMGARFKDGQHVPPNCAFITSTTFYAGGFGKEIEGMTTFGWVSDLFNKEIEKLFPYIEKHKYTGMIYFHFFKDGGLYGLSPFANPDYFPVHAHLVDIFGEDSKDEVVGSLRVTIPPYPFDDNRYNDFVYTSTKGLKVSGVKSMLPDDLMYKDGWITAGCNGIVGDIVASSSNVLGVCKQLAHTFEGIDVSEKTARVDFIDYMTERFNEFAPEKIGEKARKKLKPPELSVAYIEAVKRGDLQKVIKISRLKRENLGG